MVVWHVQVKFLPMPIDELVAWSSEVELYCKAFACRTVEKEPDCTAVVNALR